MPFLYIIDIHPIINKILYSLYKVVLRLVCLLYLNRLNQVTPKIELCKADKIAYPCPPYLTWGIIQDPKQKRFVAKRTKSFLITLTSGHSHLAFEYQIPLTAYIALDLSILLIDLYS